MTRSEISDATDIGPGQVAQALNKLKSLGVVTDSLVLPQSPARERRFTLDTNRADELLQALGTFVTVVSTDDVPTERQGVQSNS